MAITWKNTTSYSQGEALSERKPREYTASIGGMRIVLHRYRGMPPDMWLGTVYHGPPITCRELKSTDAREAQNELIGMIHEWLEAALKALTS